MPEDVRRQDLVLGNRAGDGGQTDRRVIDINDSCGLGRGERALRSAFSVGVGDSNGNQRADIRVTQCIGCSMWHR